jgi:hypothetical protein
MAAALMMMGGAISCQSSQSASSAGSSASASRREEVRAEFWQGSPRDLSQDEAAGHVLRKHAGRTDDELRERLERERNISGASTYTTALPRNMPSARPSLCRRTVLNAG